MPRPKFESQENQLDSMIRVDHAGEYGATRIYKGQIDACRNAEDKALLKHMYRQEQVHLDFFEQQMKMRKTRPTLLLPLWHIGGYAMGFITSLMGKKSAMLCTQSVEEVIGKHYEEQIKILQNNEEEHELKAKIEQFKTEELEHMGIAVEHGSRRAPAYQLSYQVIRSICKGAINLSKRI